MVEGGMGLFNNHPNLFKDSTNIIERGKIVSFGLNDSGMSMNLNQLK